MEYEPDYARKEVWSIARTEFIGGKRLCYSDYEASTTNKNTKPKKTNDRNGAVVSKPGSFGPNQDFLSKDKKKTNEKSTNL